MCPFRSEVSPLSEPARRWRADSCRTLDELEAEYN